MLRYHTTSDRAYYRAFNELRKLQKERRLQEIGFVSQNPQPQPEAPPPNIAEPAPNVSAVPEIGENRVPEPQVTSEDAENRPAWHSATPQKAA